MMTNTNDTRPRRGGVIILAAPVGHVRAARGLVGRAIRDALKVRKWYQAPHYVDYVTDAEALAEDMGGDPRYYLDVTDVEWALVLAVIHRMASADGWSCAPIDAYYDHPFSEDLEGLDEAELRRRAVQ